MTPIIRFVLSSLLVLAVLNLAGIGHAAAAEVNVGDSRDAVIKALGEPDGSVQSGDIEFLYYSRGEVEMGPDGVVGSTVISQAEFDRREEQRKKEEAEQRKRSEEQKQQRIVEGTKEKQRVLNNEAFAKRSLADQAKYWREFDRKYPEVGASQELSAIRAQQNEADLKRRQEELAAEVAAKPPEDLNRRKKKKWMKGKSRRDAETAEELGLEL